VRDFDAAFDRYGSTTAVTAAQSCCPLDPNKQSRPSLKDNWVSLAKPCFGLTLCFKDEASSDGGTDHLVRHFGPHQVVKSFPSTMPRYQIIRIDLLKAAMTCRMYSSVSGGTIWKPPMTACTFWLPEAVCACLMVLMTPR